MDNFQSAQSGPTFCEKACVVKEQKPPAKGLDQASHTGKPKARSTDRHRNGKSEEQERWLGVGGNGDGRGYFPGQGLLADSDASWAILFLSLARNPRRVLAPFLGPLKLFFGHVRTHFGQARFLRRFGKGVFLVCPGLRSPGFDLG